MFCQHHSLISLPAGSAMISGIDTTDEQFVSITDPTTNQEIMVPVSQSNLGPFESLLAATEVADNQSEENPGEGKQHKRLFCDYWTHNFFLNKRSEPVYYNLVTWVVVFLLRFEGYRKFPMDVFGSHISFTATNLLHTSCPCEVPLYLSQRKK